jgi:hypothetical protein
VEHGAHFLFLYYPTRTGGAATQTKRMTIGYNTRLLPWNHPSDLAPSDTSGNVSVTLFRSTAERWQAYVPEAHEQVEAEVEEEGDVAPRAPVRASPLVGLLAHGVEPLVPVCVRKPLQSLTVRFATLSSAVYREGRGRPARQKRKESGTPATRNSVAKNHSVRPAPLPLRNLRRHPGRERESQSRGAPTLRWRLSSARVAMRDGRAVRARGELR